MTNAKRSMILAGLLLSSSLAGAADFIRMFPSADPYMPPEEALVDLAVGMQDPNADADNNPSGTTSGFTYWGQKIDHELTLMDVPLNDANDIAIVQNKRTFRFDLDSMYGGGPTQNPEFYESDGRFKLSTPNGFTDYPRDATGRALINEPRNDENLIICQFQLIWMRYHNRLITEGMSFQAARLLVTRVWQYLIVHEFLPRIVGQDVVDMFLTYNGAGKPKIKTPNVNFNKGQMPQTFVELAAAIYRIGHTWVRLAYATKDPPPGQAAVRLQVFNLQANDLRGNRPIPPNLKIDWHNFFVIEGDPNPPVPPQLNIGRANDALVSRSMFALPVGPVVEVGPPAVTSLPERNLLRGRRLGLPSYQDFAERIGVVPLTNAELAQAPGLETLTDPVWEGQAPLWAGILGESKIREGGRRAGPTAGRFIAEVFLAAMWADKDSYMNTPQAWDPPENASTISRLITLVSE